MQSQANASSPDEVQQRFLLIQLINLSTRGFWNLGLSERWAVQSHFFVFFQLLFSHLLRCRRMLRHCFAVKLQKSFVDHESVHQRGGDNLPNFRFFVWTFPLIFHIWGNFCSFFPADISVSTTTEPPLTYLPPMSPTPTPASNTTQDPQGFSTTGLLSTAETSVTAALGNASFVPYNSSHAPQWTASAFYTSMSSTTTCCKKTFYFYFFLSLDC